MYTTNTLGIFRIILTPVENAVRVTALNLQFNTHVNISKLLLTSLSYKTKDLPCFLVFP